ncbi:17-beta-hydroxysteroid dehydrogenase type 6, partial [Biomphalaria pfeifferi]
RTAIPGFTAYSASKFAVIGFSDSLRREMKHFDVKVITIEPSLYKTGLSAHFILQNDVFWSIAEPAVRRDYGGKFFSDTQLSRNRLLNRARKSIDEVVDCCVHSVTAAYPSKRYVRPRHLRIFNDFFNEMFLDFQDLILYYITGIYTKPDMMCHRNQDIEHHMLGRRRSYAT